MVMARSTLAFATLSLVLLASCAPQTTTVTNNVTEDDDHQHRHRRLAR
jgi:outer membrane biogenesis lipoprotein LolB